MNRFRTALLLTSLAWIGSFAAAQQKLELPHAADLVNLHDANVGFGGTGLFTQSLTSQNGVPHQAETGSAGFLFSFRDHPVRFLDVEVNYQYSSYTERFLLLTPGPVVNVPLSFHEFSAGYVFHKHPDRLHPLKPLPYVVIGGGTLYFNPSSDTKTQLRPTGLVEIGADLPTFNPHVSYRLGGRLLPYKAPNFHHPELATGAWHVTVEPAISIVLHY